MKIKRYLICLVVTYTTNVMAMPFTWIFSEINPDTTCSKVIEAAEKPNSSPNDCGQFFPVTHVHRKKFEETCRKIMWEHIQKKSPDSLENCKTQISMIQEIKQSEDDKALEQIITTTSAPILPVAIPNLVSSAMVECNDPKEDYACTIYDADLQQSLSVFQQVAGQLPLNNFSVDTFENPKYSPSSCKCLEKKLAADYESQHKNLSHRVLSLEIDKEKKKLNDIIFNAAGKKFINDFSSNMEDVRYYLTNNVKALHQDPKRATALQCTNVNDYKEAMKSECALNDIDPAKRDRRIESFMGVFGDFIDKPTLEGKFKSLEEDILNTTTEVSKTRRSYDILRLGIVKSNPQVKFIDEITDFILEDPELARELNLKISFGEQPGHAIYELIRDEKSPATQRLIKKVTDKNLGLNIFAKNRTFYNNLNIASKTGIETDFADMVRDAYKIAVEQYPGFKAIFKDPDLFRKITDMKGSRSLIEKLEGNPSLLGNYYENNCEKIKEQFVQSVCAPENGLIQKISPDDLNKYLTFTKKDVDSTLKDTILCRMINSRAKGDQFIKLIDPNTNINLSDYLDRKSKPDQKRTSGYANFIKSIDNGNSAVTKYIERISSIGEKERISSPEIASLANIPKAAITPSSALGKQSTVLSDKNEENILSKSQSSNVNAMAANTYITPSASLSSPSPIKKTTKNNKALLRDFLADESNKAEVEKLLSNTSDEDLKELLRLKDEIAKDKERMNELVRETERMKVKNLEQNLESLEKEINTPVKVASQSADNSYEAPVFQGGSLSGSMVSKTGTMDNRDASHFSESSSGQATTSKGSSSSAAQITRSPASRADLGAVKETSRGAIIIESKMVRVNDKEFGQEDLSKEVISYVTQTDLDVQTLKRLKETGVVLKFKVLKDGVEIQQEMKVQYSSLTAEAKSILDKKIANQEKSQEYQRVKRAHSFAALKLILGLKTQEQIN